MSMAFNSTENLPQLSSRFTWPAWLQYFLQVEPVNFQKGLPYISVAQLQEKDMSIEKSIFEEKSTNRKATFKSIFKF